VSRQRPPRGPATSYEQRQADLRRLAKLGTSYSIEAYEEAKLEQIVRALAEDSSPSTQRIGEAMLGQTAVRLARQRVAADQQQQLPEQMRQLAKQSGEARRKKNLKRDRKIHDMHSDGESQISIVVALKPKLSQAQVSRILKKPRP
jgi:hypothetical protein